MTSACCCARPAGGTASAGKPVVVSGRAPRPKAALLRTRAAPSRYRDRLSHLRRGRSIVLAYLPIRFVGRIRTDIPITDVGIPGPECHAGWHYDGLWPGGGAIPGAARPSAELEQSSRQTWQFACGASSLRDCELTLWVVLSGRADVNVLDGGPIDSCVGSAWLLYSLTPRLCPEAPLFNRHRFLTHYDLPGRAHRSATLSGAIGRVTLVPAGRGMHAVVRKTRATTMPDNKPVSWKDLRSGMACHLLKNE